MGFSDNVCKRCGGVLSFRYNWGPPGTVVQAPFVTGNASSVYPPTIYPFDASITATAGTSLVRYCSCLHTAASG